MKKQVLMCCSLTMAAALSTFGQASGGGAAGGGAGGGSAGAGGGAAGIGSQGTAIQGQRVISGGRNTGIGAAGAGATTGLAGGAGIGPAGNSTAGTANGTTGTSSSGFHPDANNNLPPGLQNRQLPPNTNLPQDPRRPGQRMPQHIQAMTNGLGQPWATTNMAGRYTNQVPSTNRVGIVTNQVFTTNQVVLSTNTAGGAWVGTGLVGDGTATGAGGGVTAQTTPTIRGIPPAGNPSPFATAATTPPGTTVGMQRGDKAFTADDQSLLLRIRRDVLPITGGSESGVAPVHFNLRHGVVTLTGTVPNADVRQRVMQTVNNTPGVRQVVDQLRVGAQPAIGAAAGTGEGAALSGGATSQFGTSPAATAAPSAPSAPLAPQTGFPTGTGRPNVQITGTNSPVTR